ncbi:DUF6443 domain-containing protein [Winogradskyella forsetii]|uniref:DUF6443 domain-containing protein n=1 Tax=Winogradskyella forsetii TaxID=2686077 RepID=UPI0015BE45CD|nr:hypothetical protein [Winogradskyella forsetii]
MDCLVFLRNYILSSVILLLSISSFANEKKFTDGPIPVNTLSSSYQYIDPELGNVGITSVKPTAYLSLYINDNIPFYENFTYVLNATVYPILPDGSIDLSAAEVKIFEIEYNNNAGNFQYVDEIYFEIKNRYGIEIVVNSSQAFKSNGSSMSDIPDNISIELGFKVDRFYELPPETLPSLSFQELPSSSNPCSLIIDWSSSSNAILNAAEEFELEWTWVDNYGFNEPTRPADAIEFSVRDFELNSTRIETKQTAFEIPLIYSRGYIVYRLRVVTRFQEDITKRYYGDWTSTNAANEIVHVSDWPHVYFFTSSHEQVKNWQFQTSYAENGKNKSVVSYFDGTLRNRQTVTKINSDDNAIVGEVIYDMQGRPAIEVLPVPTDNNKIKYYPDFNVSEQVVDPSTGTLAIYSAKDFDWDIGIPEGEDPNCEVNLFGMDDSSGASKYYSTNNNSNTEKPYQDLVPDAQNFPFSQIEYTADNTGRIKRKSGVGVQHQLGNGHEMKYFYSQPNSSFELNRLFGYQVGNYKHYKKNVVVDPNGQVSVSYIDPQGRTIATALAGGNPSIGGTETEEGQPILLPLNDESEIDEFGQAIELHDRVATDLLNKLNEDDPDTLEDSNNRYATGNFGVLQDGLRVGKQIVVIENFSDYKLEYELEDSGDFTFNECASITFPYVYDVTIGLSDDCNSELIEATGIASYSRKGENAIERVWNTGEYGISKRLTVNRANLEQAWNDFLENEDCILAEEDFIPQFIFVDCDDIDCDVVELGIVAYISDKLDTLFGQGSYTLTNSTFTSADPNVTIAIAELQDGFVILEDMCEESQTCDANEAMLLSDMSPYGQYGRLDYILEYDETDGSIIEPIAFVDQLSVFNDANQLYFKGEIKQLSFDGNGQINTLIINGEVNDPSNLDFTFTWRNPANPYSENSSYSLVEVNWVNDQWLPAIAVNEVGELVEEPNLGSAFDENLYGNNLIDGKYYIHPQNLRYIPDFITNWRTDWAQSLLPYHPEYCYLSYNESICEVSYNGTTSFEFDTLLSTTVTYNDAVIAGFIPSGANSISNILSSDPFFNSLYVDEVDDYRFQRKELMAYAMDTEYDGTGVTMAQLAYTMAQCGNLATTCDSYTSFDSLDSEEKKQTFWNLYKGFYQGLKTRLYDVFISIHAKKNGCYNECLGGEARTNPDFMSLVSTYPNFSVNYSTGTPQLCSSISSSIYGAYEKRFIPADFLNDDLGVDTSEYPPTIDPGDVIDNYYNETGKCKIQVDLELFLNGFLSKNNLSSPYPYSDGFMVLDLFEALGGTQSDVTGFTIDNIINGDELTISTSLNNICNKPITLNLPESSNDNPWNSSNTWEYLGSPGYWKILSLSNSFHDIAVTVDGTYAFQLLGKVMLSDGSIKEYVFKGNTCINLLSCIPECETDDTVRYMYPQFTVGRQISGSITGIPMIIDDVIFKVPSLLFGVGEEFEVKLEVDFGNNYPNTNFNNAKLIINDVEYTIFNGLEIQPLSYNGNNTPICTEINMLAQSQYYSANYEMDYLDYSINGSNFRFDFDGNLEATIPSSTLSMVGSKPDLWIGQTGYVNISGETPGGSCNSINPTWNDGLDFDFTQGTTSIDFATRMVITDDIYDFGTQYYATVAQLENNILDRKYLVRLSMGGDPLPSGRSASKSSELANTTTTGIPLPILGSDNIVAKRFNASKHKKAKFTRNLEASSQRFLEEDCEDCIVQQVAPLSCNEKYATYMDFMGFVPQQFDGGADADGNQVNVELFVSNRIAGYELPPLFDEVYFCNANLAYIADTYIYYIEEKGVNSVDHPLFLTIGEFGNTAVNYGYDNLDTLDNEMELLIDGFDGSTTVLNDQGSEVVIEQSWSDYIDSQVKDGQGSLLVCVPKPFGMYITLPPATDTDPCEDIAQGLINTYVRDSYITYLDQLRNQFETEYINAAMENAVEHFSMEYPDKEYQYTLYYYDQAGNLIQTVAPEGIDRLGDGMSLEEKLVLTNQIDQTRESNGEDASQLPVHRMPTQYRYNSLNQLVWQKTPDGGITKFAYDDLGRIIASQNAKQAEIYSVTTNEGSESRLRFSYSNYDALGRIVEAGEIDVLVNENYSINDEGKLLILGNPEVQQDFSESQFIERREVTYTVYDNPISLASGTEDSSSLFETSYEAYSSRNRVTSILYFDTITTNTIDLNNSDNALFYNYDVHGNVKELVVQNNDMSILNNTQEYKRLQYEYDLISGNVNRVVFQKDKKDQFIHRYQYDADNRIVTIETSIDGAIWEQDASYEYYEHGPLARMNLGNKQIQGMDYIYTIQGWLKSVNSEAVLVENDPGTDGVLGGTNETVARDAYGFSLHYFEGDYSSRIIGADTNTYTHSATNSSPTNLYNGNIKQMVSSMRHLSVDGLKPRNSRTFTQNAQYFYDQLNRIKSMDASSVAVDDRNNTKFESPNAYSATYSYDRNGNLTGLTRNSLRVRNNGNVSQDPTTIEIDNFEYLYNKDDEGKIINNQLTAVSDPLGVQVNSDLDDQLQVLQDELGITYDPSNENTHNYVYDEIGQLIEDKTEGLIIEWRVDGKVRKVIKRDVDTPNSVRRQEIVFQYDGLGNRIGKNVVNYRNNGNIRDQKPTFYSRDAQGNVMAIYEKGFRSVPGLRDIEELYLKEQHIYGSSRLGLQENNELLASSDQSIVLPRAESQGFRLPFVDIDGVSQNDVFASELALEISSAIDQVINKKTKNQLPINEQLKGLDIKKIITNKIEQSYPEQGSEELIQTLYNSVNNALKILVNRKDRLSSIAGNALHQKLSNSIEPILNRFIEPRLVDQSLLAKINTVAMARSVSSGYALDFSGSNRASWADDAEFKLRKAGEFGLQTNLNVTNGSTLLEGQYLISSIKHTYGSLVDNALKIEKLELFVAKFSGLFYPVIKLKSYRIRINGAGALEIRNYKERNFTPNQSFVSPEFEIEFETTLIDDPSIASTITNFIVNDITFSSTDSTLFQVGISAGTGNENVLELINNSIGSNSNIDFTMCYFNYSTSNNGIITSRAYSFDDEFGTSATEEGGNLNLAMFLSNELMWVNGGCGDPIVYPDSDGDSITDNIDIDDDNDGILDTAETTADTDNDGIINSLDLDSDGDGIDDIYESGALGTGNIIDADGDGAIDFTDVSVFGTNGLHNALETFPDFGAVNYTIINTYPSNPVNFLNDDDDGDSVLTKDEDFDINGIGNAINEDTDGDGIPNYLDQDDDDDTVTTFQEAQDLITHYGVTPLVGARADLDGDGLLNYLDTDDDEDGYFTLEEDTLSAGNPQGTDTDGDTIPDYIDAIDNQYGQPLGDVSFADFFNKIGDKRYELSNHLGNVLSVLTDRKLPIYRKGGGTPEARYEGFTPDVIAYNDYYPFGMLLPNRHKSSLSYRYGFQGQEKDCPWNPYR